MSPSICRSPPGVALTISTPGRKWKAFASPRKPRSLLFIKLPFASALTMKAWLSACFPSR